MSRVVDLLNATASLAGVNVTRDIPYGPAVRHRLDIYRPARAVGPMPAIAFFYGGGWRFGERRHYRFVAASFARAGLIVAIPDYRLFPEVRFPSFIEDGALAVAEVRRRVASEGGDPERLFLVGHSAGAYIAAMLAIAPAYLAEVGLARKNLAGVVGLAGPYDFLPITLASIKPVFASAADDLRRTQPISHVDGHNAPLLLLHGDRDSLCYPRNSLALAARVHSAGGPAHVRTYRLVDHYRIILSFAQPLRFLAPAFADTVRFIRGAWDEPDARAIPPAA